MAKSSLEDSASAENPPYASHIVFTHLAKGYAIVRVSLDHRLNQYSPSLIHEYLLALCELLEQAQAKLAREWEIRFREQVGNPS